jgi:hypothetical protein
MEHAIHGWLLRTCIHPHNIFCASHDLPSKLVIRHLQWQLKDAPPDTCMQTVNHSPRDTVETRCLFILMICLPYTHSITSPLNNTRPRGCNTGALCWTTRLSVKTPPPLPLSGRNGILLLERVFNQCFSPMLSLIVATRGNARRHPLLRPGVEVWKQHHPHPRKQRAIQQNELPRRGGSLLA